MGHSLPCSAAVQLELALTGCEPASTVEPWQGVSPRVLTEGYKRFNLKAQAAKSMSDFVDPEQYDLWMFIKKAPWKYQGAPLLKEVSHE